MKIFRIALFLSTFLLFGCTLTSATSGWRVEEFPAPKETSSVVDPDGILSEASMASLHEKIHSLDVSVSVSVPNDQSSVAVQVAVAIVEKVPYEYRNMASYILLFDHR
jgi:uncharacterized membrane protein YgcG